MAKKKSKEKQILENGNVRIYLFSQITGEFIAEDEARPNPLEPGKFILPPNATETAPPSYQNGKVRKFVDGEWVFVDVTAETPKSHDTPEYKAAQIRGQRNAMLTASDWTQLPDVPAWVNKAAWATYRQALRDVPQQETFPNSVEYPSTPKRS